MSDIAHFCESTETQAGISEEVLDLPAIEIYRKTCSRPLTFRPSKSTECFEIQLKCSLPCSCLGLTAMSLFICVALRGKIEMVKSIWKFVVRVGTVGTLICAG